jgi:hypothetical protein
LKDNKADKIEIEQRPRIMIMSVVKGEGKNEVSANVSGEGILEKQGLGAVATDADLM